MTEVRVQKQYAYALVEDDHLRVRKQYAYAFVDQPSDARVSQLNKQVLFQPPSDLDISQITKQVLYQIVPPRPYKLSGVTTMFGNLDRVLYPIQWGLPLVTATRFRLRVTASMASAGFQTISLNEFYLIGPDGEQIDRTGAVATAHHDWGGSETPDKVVDDDVGTWWAARRDTFEGVGWIEIEMPEPTQVRGFGMAPRGTDSTNFKDFTFEYHDGEDWVQWGPAFVENVTVNRGDIKWYGFPSRWWRVYCTASGTTHAGLAEIEFRSELGTPELHSGGLPFANGHWGTTESAVHAFDDDPVTHWGVGGFPSWVGYRFPDQKQVEEVFLKARSTSGVSFPTAFEIQYSDDLGATWTVAASANRELTAANGTERTYEIGWHSLIMTSTNSWSAGWADYTVRQRVAASILDREGDHVRLTFRAATGGTKFNVSKVSVGKKGSGNYDFADTPVAVTFGGNPGFELDGDLVEEIVSDPIPLVVDGEDDLIIAFLVTNNGNLPFSTSSFSSVFSRAYKKADEVFSPLVASGYSEGGSSTTFVRRIEVATLGE